MKKLIPLCLFLSLFNICFSQSYSGRVLDAETRTPLAYAHLYLPDENGGSVTDENGQFSLPMFENKIRLKISYLGYEVLDTEVSMHDTVLLLKKKSNLLNEVAVYSNYDFLYDWIRTLKSNHTKVKYESKCYYQLKSFVDGYQQEFIEAYYNGVFYGVKLDKLDMKNGRFYLGEGNGRFYFSSETSKTFHSFQLYEKNSFFPENPLSLSKSKLKKYYHLKIEEQFLDGGDTVCVISFSPKNEDITLFTGKLWLNRNNFELKKVELVKLGSSLHPFISIWGQDTITGVDLFLEQSFMDNNYVDQLKFNYNVYFSPENEEKYVSKTECFIQAYDLNEPFDLPFFKFSELMYKDYYQLSSLPQNKFFWENYKGFYSNLDDKEQALFTENLSVMNQSNAYQKSVFFSTGMLEHKFVHWSEERILIHPKTDLTAYLDYPPSARYNLVCQWFFDFDEFEGKSDYVLTTIIDPMESFFYYPMDAKSMAFINIYFDLFEIQKRALEKALSQNNFKRQEAEQLYMTYWQKAESMAKKYTREVERGNNQAKLMKWNEYVLKELRIDNVELAVQFMQ